MHASTIRLSAVTKRFGEVLAVDAATFRVDRGETVALLGPSGCGKTTLLRLIAGFDAPDAGTVEVTGRTVAGDAWVAPEDRRVGMVFQDYALFGHLTVEGNVGFGLSRRARAGRVSEMLCLVGLEDVARRYPHELSGGQQQRVALARALAPAPDVILLDEPWSNVDPQLRDSLRHEVSAILRPLGVTVVLVTHDREEAFSLADRVILVRDGAVVQQGAAEELYFRPVSRWAAEFAGAANFVPGRAEHGVVTTHLGRFPAHGAGHDTEVDVLVRPELLELVPDASGPGEVVARAFRGHDVIYRVRMNGRELVAQRPSTEAVALGERVSVRVHPGPVAVVD